MESGWQQPSELRLLAEKLNLLDFSVRSAVACFSSADELFCGMYGNGVGWQCCILEPKLDGGVVLTVVEARGLGTKKKKKKKKKKYIYIYIYIYILEHHFVVHVTINKQTTFLLHILWLIITSINYIVHV